ncbi:MULTISPECIES: hypothetical protein [Clostridium]|uniref:DUF2922 domain-containing protein n=1 Tax=Clostridium paridis TaxID=2803863 RepID=A0A937K2V3_9CLOT|nr:MULTISPECIES: hypothetical protein [Clostridium]MBL4931002.1 hypothetical protein [Clostridium paridis]
MAVKLIMDSGKEYVLSNENITVSDIIDICYEKEEVKDEAGNVMSIIKETNKFFNIDMNTAIHTSHISSIEQL